mmetsp:Transcript_3954/g.5155  ORF Transcript_3954/g.5155 Transcript_3954/m.5155 type:complete len:330 (+) Transcript_3954:16-1005(+)
MAMRDVVSGGCGGGSAVTSLATDFLATEKLAQDELRWADEYQAEYRNAKGGMGPHAGPHAAPHFMPAAPSLRETFEAEFLRETEAGAFEHMEQMEHTPEMREEVDFSLRTIFHAIQHDGMIGPLGKLPFSPQEQQKIQNRLSTLGRHMAPNPAAGEILVQNALRQLDIHGPMPAPPPPSLASAWTQEFEAKGVPDQVNFEEEYRRAFQTPGVGSTALIPRQRMGNAWETEFQQQHEQNHNFEEAWERISKQHNLPATGSVTTGQIWENEFAKEKEEEVEPQARQVPPKVISDEERLLREEEEKWFAQFIPHSAKKSKLANDWVNEFGAE